MMLLVATWQRSMKKAYGEFITQCDGNQLMRSTTEATDGRAKEKKRQKEKQETRSMQKVT